MEFLKNIIFNLFYKFYLRARAFEQNSVYNTFKKKYEIHPSVRFNGQDIYLYGEGKIVFGENSYIGRYSTIQAAEGYSVVIGKNCSISHNVRIYTTTAIPDDDWEKTPKRRINGSVVIEDYAWIGANVFINPGITIGKCSVVGANSVVTKDIPSYVICGGVPAKIIREKGLKRNSHQND